MRNTSFALALIFATTAFGGEIFIPAAYRGAGAAGSAWRTEITISNITTGLSATPVPTTVTLHRQDGPPLSVAMPLSPMEVITVPDALHDWFSLENASGLIRVTWDDAEARITTRARIYNVSSGGEYGQGIPGVRVNELLSDHFLPGLSGVDGNRTNVGVSNPHDQHVMFWVTLYDTSGLSRGAFATSVPPRSYVQFNDIFAHFQAGPLNAAMVRVTGTDNTLYAYASIVRNDTGDPTFVTPAR